MNPTLSGRNRGHARLFPHAFFLLLLGSLCLASLGAQAASKDDDKTLVVYTYDSFVADWGAAPKIAPLFEAATGIKIKFVSKGDGGQLLSTLILEKGGDADVVLGLDNFLAPKALASKLLRPYAPKGYDSIPAELKLDAGNCLIPYDSGFFAIVWDSAKLKNPPTRLEDLTKPQYAKKLILLDPRTSTPGLGFVAWTKAVYGPAWKDFWKRLKPSVLTLSPSWDQGYGLFSNGEAPLVLSYATDGAYNLETAKNEKIKALDFKEGLVRQVETAGILATAKHPRNAELFMDFLISEACQKELPLTQWMYPALPSVKLPDSYRAAVQPAKALKLDPQGLNQDALTAADILSGN